MILQFARSGNLVWYAMMNDLAHHVLDIDIYHAEDDKSAYNGGLFWHTDHYSDAGTATHRGFSQKTMLEKGLSYYGGGPSNEHDYPTGLKYHYYLTGEIASKEGALSLATWIINMDDGAKTPFRYLNRRPTGGASSTASVTYHGPGRGAGYSLNAMLDGYTLSGDRKYLAKAEELLQRCIHPHDDIKARELHDVENRWSYTVFLQAVGRYLDLKTSLNELDGMFCYARESLLHYADWMRDHEVRFVEIFDKVEYPTETWPAQDLRKSYVFMFAAKYAEEPLRPQFLDKAAYFFDHAIEDFMSFDTKTFARPMILVMNHTAMHAYFHMYPNESAPHIECRHDFGQPQKFKPQLYEVHTLRIMVRNVIARVKHMISSAR
jgi:hypothetical protein